VAHYEVLEPLGAGGMGWVCRARDTRLDRPVALKFLPPQLALDPDLARRFLVEARAASALDHPAICTIHGIEEDDEGRPFIVMALYEGESLKDRIARGPLAPAVAVELVRQAAEGLAAAHRRGILHRDVKPANLFVTRRGELKILDFGLAKLAGSDKITRTGTTMGTLAYMAPEQVRGEVADERTDLWQLGVVAYEAVVGQNPFWAATEAAVLMRILDTEPSPPGSAAASLAPLDGFFARALAKPREARFASAEEMLDALAGLAGGLDDAEPAAPASDRTLFAPSGAGATLVLPTPARGIPAARPVAAADRELEAFEYCARARQRIGVMGLASIEEARADLERALELDPEYALAHSSLGHLRCMRFIATTDRADLEAAVGHLERARELDAELGDTEIWSAYAYARLGRFDEANAAGRRAVALEPDSPMAHYQLAVSLWIRGVMGAGVEGWAEAIRHLERVAELAPRYQAGHQIAGSILLACGRYERAERCFARAAAIERSGEFDLARFVGGAALQGRALHRLGRFDRAAELLAEGLSAAAAIDHVYSAATRAQARVWAGDVLLRRQGPAEALRAYRTANEEIAASPTSLGMGWVRIRALLGLARAFRALLMQREATRSLGEATELLASRAAHDFACIWEGGEAEARAELALVHAAAGKRSEALAELELAFERGWRDGARLDVEPGFEALAAEPRLAELRRRLDAADPLPDAETS
jgi:serine/threonine-protein kinase